MRVRRGALRLVLAAAFLLARAALGLSASAHPGHAAPDPALAHAAAAVHGTDSGQADTDGCCCPEPNLACTCGPGLCGTALAVLPAGPSWAPASSPGADYAAAPASVALETRLPPETPPPRA